MHGRILGVIACVSMFPLGAHARDGWSFETFLGDAYNFHSRLKIDQESFRRELTADYDTRGFQTPLYYSMRVARRQGDGAWELQHIHHKIYLRNPPAGVASLSVSHGFNIVTANRAWDRNGMTVRLGAGVVVTHAEGTINGVLYDGPYELAGVALLAGVGKRLYLSRAAFFQIESQATAGYAKPEPKCDPALKLSVANVALHGLLGVGVDF